MNSHDPAWPCRKMHTLPVGRCTCAHSPALAASSSTDALCISDVLAGRRLAVLVFEPMEVPMTGTAERNRHHGHRPNRALCRRPTTGGYPGGEGPGLRRPSARCASTLHRWRRSGIVEVAPSLGLMP